MNGWWGETESLTGDLRGQKVGFSLGQEPLLQHMLREGLEVSLYATLL